MAKVTKVFITTDDTGKTHEMPGYGGATCEKCRQVTKKQDVR